MRRVVWLMHVSLDGYVARADGSLDWIKLDDELFDYVNTVTAEADTALYGGKTYPMMEAHWPTAADQPDASEHDVTHGNWANQAHKLVFSNTITETHWDDKTEIVSADIAAKIAELKAQPGKNLLLLGSPGLGHSFMKLGLIDEFRLNINPIVLGEGLPLFAETPLQLQIVEAKQLDSGVLVTWYNKIG